MFDTEERQSDEWFDQSRVKKIIFVLAFGMCAEGSVVQWQGFEASWFLIQLESAQSSIIRRAS